jgi:hypothetical protein
MSVWQGSTSYAASFTASSVNTIASLTPYATYRYPGNLTAFWTPADRSCTIFGETSITCKYYVTAFGEIEVFRHESSAPAGETLDFAQVPITHAPSAGALSSLASCMTPAAAETSRNTGTPSSSTSTSASGERPAKSSGGSTPANHH